MESEISHPLLLAQIEQHLGQIEDAPAGLRQLLIDIDRSYHESDALRDRLRRSVSLSLEKLLTLSGGRGVQVQELEGEIRRAQVLLAEPVLGCEPSASLRGERPQRTILCVENETGLRNLMVRLLSARGYRVLEAESPQRALQLAEESSGEISLLVCESVLPGTTGPSLRARLRPHLAGGVLYLCAGERAHGLLAEPDALVLRKPFSIEELADRVQQALFGE
jgi:CheY-like chemotaxis protein